VKAGETAHLTATDLTLEGEGVGTLEGREIHTPGLFPGEQADVRIEAVSRHHARAHARVVQLTVAHPRRREAPCPKHEARFGACAGCALMELDEQAQRDEKRTMLRVRFGLSVSEVENSPLALGYRWSSKRVAFGRPGALGLGSFARGSHRTTSMHGCLVDHPLLTELFAAIAQKACELGIEAYDERTRQGDLRFVWAKTNGEAAIVTLVVSSAEGRAAKELARADLPCAGVLVSVQSRASNSARGQAPEVARGVSALNTELLGETIEVGALGFLQPNPRTAELCYRALTEWPQGAKGALAFDLYAGSGVTTRALARSFSRVVPCESYPESAQALGVAPETAEHFLARVNADPERVVPERVVPELVVLNPPRKGLGPEVCARLLELGSPEVRIMSCGPEGLARDLAALAPHYELVSLRAFDTLPQTPHVELVAKLQRKAQA
jgi:tRNA/tmRNA/rRNA uracil-C5-methylase (TrmA/RlmC/RlmD family)